MNLLDLYLDAWKKRDGKLVSSLDYIVNEQDILDALSGKDRVEYNLYLVLREQVPYSEIVRNFSMAYQTVAQFGFQLRRKGFPLSLRKTGRKERHPLYYISIDRLLQDPLLSYTDVATLAGASPHSVRNRARNLRSKGVVVSERNNFSHHDRLLDDALSFQYSTRELAKKYHLTRCGVCDIFQRCGGFSSKDISLVIKQNQ